MRDRLIELLNECRAIEGCGLDLVEKQADHLLANGVIVPPCKVGSGRKLYYPVIGTDKILETKVLGMGVDEEGDMVINPTSYHEKVIEMRGVEVGKTVFLTKEEAERALERSKE